MHASTNRGAQAGLRGHKRYMDLTAVRVHHTRFMCTGKVLGVKMPPRVHQHPHAHPACKHLQHLSLGTSTFHVCTHHMHTSPHTRMHTSPYTHTCIRQTLGGNVHTSTHSRVGACVEPNTRTRHATRESQGYAAVYGNTRTRTHTRTRVCTHTQSHTHTITHMHPHAITRTRHATRESQG